ncbi:MAG: hypothetical protein JWR82_1200, partial [Blastococcus sp.]|nr:hypothetical protein [Blastococcus sp.]
MSAEAIADVGRIFREHYGEAVAVLTAVRRWPRNAV